VAVLLTLYSRRYCHLCDDMRAALDALRREFAFELAIRDVDADPLLLARYDERVPVLAAGEGITAAELCHYFLDAERVRAYLAGRGEEPA
jgi:hypothetical protein